MLSLILYWRYENVMNPWRIMFALKCIKKSHKWVENKPMNFDWLFYDPLNHRSLFHDKQTLLLYSSRYMYFLRPERPAEATVHCTPTQSIIGLKTGVHGWDMGECVCVHRETVRAPSLPCANTVGFARGRCTGRGDSQRQCYQFTFCRCLSSRTPPSSLVRVIIRHHAVAVITRFSPENNPYPVAR